ncbi:MAG: hypothetical protein Q8O67_01750 [Deltaproteobacteria bacterium]|nr:hypothetical protein [Deltaproteobacteria bacterium]
MLADALLLVAFVVLLRLMGERLPLPGRVGRLGSVGGLEVVLALVILGSFVGWGEAIALHGRAVVAYVFLDGPAPSEIAACTKDRERWVAHGKHRVAVDDDELRLQMLYIGPTDCPHGGKWVERGGLVSCTLHDPLPPAAP